MIFSIIFVYASLYFQFSTSSAYVLVPGQCPNIPVAENFNMATSFHKIYNYMMSRTHGSQNQRCTRYYGYKYDFENSRIWIKFGWISNVDGVDEVRKEGIVDTFNVHQENGKLSAVLPDVDLFRGLYDQILNGNAIDGVNREALAQAIKNSVGSLNHTYNIVFYSPQKLITLYGCFDASEIYPEFQPGSLRLEFAVICGSTETAPYSEIGESIAFLAQHGVHVNAMVPIYQEDCELLDNFFEV